jgi:hypothetical protein
VRTRTLGAAWEERFLQAVQKAREQNLIPRDAAEKLRLLAGVYLCGRCKKEHRTESALGKEHLRLQPASPATAKDVPAAQRKPHPAPAAKGAPEAKGKAKRAASPKGKARGRVEVSAEAALPVALAEGAKARGAPARTVLRPAQSTLPLEGAREAPSPPLPAKGKARHKARKR